jgi:group I intron endonuclease
MDILEPLYNESCIYCILNYDNGKMYFGLTKHFKVRVRDHINDLKAIRHGNDYLQKAWNKKQKFVIFPVEKCNISNLAEREIFWIDYHKTSIRNNGYNLTLGGEDLSHMTKEALEKRSRTRTGKTTALKGKKQSPEWIEARMVKLRGQKRTYTPEHIEAIKNAMAKNKGKRRKGKIVKVINLATDEVMSFNSKREVEDFLQIKRDSLIHKFYYGRPRQILKETIYNNFLIQR